MCLSPIPIYGVRRQAHCQTNHFLSLFTNYHLSNIMTTLYIFSFAVLAFLLGYYIYISADVDRALLAVIKSSEIMTVFNIDDQQSLDYNSSIAYLQDAVNREVHRVTEVNTAAVIKLIRVKRINNVRLLLLFLTMTILITAILVTGTASSSNTALHVAAEISLTISAVFLVATAKVRIPVINNKNTFTCLVPLLR